jgi:hypothetical protein
MNEQCVLFILQQLISKNDSGPLQNRGYQRKSRLWSLAYQDVGELL